MKKLITIFGPSECTPGSSLYDSTERLGILLAEAGFGIVNGGYGGVMEAVSKGARSANGGVIAVTAEVYFARGREPNEFITKEVTVKSANDRLMELLDLADAYIACGISPGTLIEVATAWDYMLKRFMQEKPFILLGKEWKDLCAILFAQDAYKGKEHLVTFVTTPQEALEELIVKFGKQEKLPELIVVSSQ
jgi:uncharacterized protein (TIGR00725 family)